MNPYIISFFWKRRRSSKKNSDVTTDITVKTMRLSSSMKLLPVLITALLLRATPTAGWASSHHPSFITTLSSRVPSTTTTTASPFDSRKSSSSSSAVSALFVSNVDNAASDFENNVVEDEAAVTRRWTTRTSRMINAGIVGMLATGAFYSLTHTHFEALVALWEYDLGPHPPEITKATVALDVLQRYPIDLVRSYEALVPQNPIFYKACTSGVAYGLGDFISQVLQGKRLEELDLPRSFRSSAAGFIGHGPLCHYWLMTMENYLDFGGAWWATGIKVTADLTVWSIFLNAAYSFIIGTLAFRPPGEVLKEVKATQWPALRSAWRFWPFVHTISFSHAVPMDLKLLWVDVMEVVWVTILSKVANEDKNAQLQQANEEEVDTAALALQISEEKAFLADRTPIEQAVETTQKVWNAAWPLVVMWPVLYAGYQVEHMLGFVE